MIDRTRTWYPLGALLAGAGAVVLIGPAPALAQSVAPPDAELTSALAGEGGDAADEWSFTLGAGAGFAPDYEGSEDYEVVPLLLARVQRNDIFVTLEANTLRANLLPVPGVPGRPARPLPPRA